MQKACVMLVSVMSMVVLGFSTISAADVPVCTESHDQSSPAISGDRIVWVDCRNEERTGYDIYINDLGGDGIPLCSEPGWKPGWDRSPAISGGKVVWDGNGSLYLYDIATGEETLIAFITSPPAMSGNRIVWSKRGDYSDDLYMYDITTQKETPICTDQYSDQKNPSISGDKIVWQDDRVLSEDIYMYDLTTGEETLICGGDASAQKNPVISGDRIVWMDERNGDKDIYMYDLANGKESPICTLSGAEWYPSIDGDKIVWEDDRNGDGGDIYGYDIAAGVEFPVCTAPGWQSSPKISGNKVVWTDYRNGNYDIYMGEIPSVPSSTTTTAVSTTTTASGTTTSTIPSEPCPVEQLYGEHSEEVAFLRCFRDDILSQTPEGREIIKLYYELSPVIVSMVGGDGELNEEAKKVIDGILQLMSAK